MFHRTHQLIKSFTTQGRNNIPKERETTGPNKTKRGAMLRELFRSLLIVPIIVIFWQATLYHQRRPATDVTGALRLCYEIFGAASEIGFRPPEFIVSVCARQLPETFKMDHTKAMSSIVTIGKYVEARLPQAQRSGYMSFITSMTLRDVAMLANAANWVRLLPSLLIVSPQIRGGIATLYLTALLASVPCHIEDLAWGLHLLAVIAVADWALQIFEARTVTIPSKSGGAPRKFRRKLRSIVKEEVAYFVTQIVLPVALVLCVALLMAMLAAFIEANHDLFFVDSSSGAR